MSQSACSAYFATRQTRRECLRDHRVDFFRGAALLCIFIDHIPGNHLARLTLHNFGFSDAAELFVLLAGFSSAIAYSRPGSYSLLLKRILTIYCAQVLLIVIAALLLLAAAVASGHAGLSGHKILHAFSTAPGATLLRTLLLDFQPEYFDILPLYIALLAWLPVVLFLAGRSKRLALAVSIAIWLFSHQFRLNFPGERNGGWYFDPLAWQLVFTAGVLLGLRGEKRGDSHARRSPWVLFMAIGFLVFAFLYSAPWSKLPIGELRHFRIIPDHFLGDMSKTFESPWRLIHVASIAYVASWAVPVHSNFLRRDIARWVSELGRHSLIIFMLASLFSTLGAISLALMGRGLWQQALINGVGLGILIWLGRQHNAESRSASPPRRLAVDPAPA